MRLRLVQVTPGDRWMNLAIRHGLSSEFTVPMLCRCPAGANPFACHSMDDALYLNGLLLDMDGLLLDTERISLKCWEKAEKVSGFTMPEGFYPTLIGQTMRTIHVHLKAIVPPDFDLEGFIEVANKSYHDAVDNKPIPLKPGTRELLECIQKRSIPVSLVTSTNRYLADRKLELVKLAELIPVRVCGDEVKNGKPSPDIYLKAAVTLGFPPDSLLALEDSENGLRAALGAGCRVGHVPDICPVGMAVQAKVDRVFRSLVEVREAIEREELVFGSQSSTS